MSEYNANMFEHTIQERKNDAQLCRSYRTGNDEAFIILWDKSYDLFQSVLHEIKNELIHSNLNVSCLDEEDIIQEAKISLLKRIKDPRVYKQIESGNFKGFIYDTMYGDIYEYLHHNGLLKKLVLATDDNFETFYKDPADIVESISSKEELRVFISELTQREQAVVDLRAQEYTYRQIANIYNVSLERIRQVNHKARRKLAGKIHRRNINNMSRNITYSNANHQISDMYNRNDSFKDLLHPVSLPKYIHPECLMGVNIKEYKLPVYEDHKEEWETAQFLNSVMKELNEFTILVYKKLGFKIISNNDKEVLVVLPYFGKSKKYFCNHDILDEKYKTCLRVWHNQTFDKFICSYDTRFAIVKINNSIVTWPLNLKSIYF